MSSLLYPLPKRTTVRADGPKTSTHSGCYTRGRIKKPRVIVIHAMQSGEGATTAEAVGAWFQNPKAKGSAHKGVDPDSICTYVDDGDTAWGAPHVNADGLHVEHAGMSEQTAAQWRDDKSLRIIENGAIVVAEWCIKYAIPPRWLTRAQLRDGVSKGLATHKQCSDALGGSHWDPGPGFPDDYYLRRVKFHIARLTSTAPPTKPPAPITSKEPIMHTLVKLDTHDAVWLSDLITRRWVQSRDELALLQATLKSRGVPSAVTVVTSLAPYGVPVGKLPPA